MNLFVAMNMDRHSTKDQKIKIFSGKSYREKLLAFDGYSRGLDTTNNVKEYFNAFRDDLATEELFKDEIQSKIIFTQEEIDTVAKQKIT